MLGNLSDRLQSVLGNIGKENKLTRESVDRALVEIRHVLIEADVHLTVIKSFLHKVREHAIGERIVGTVTPTQKFIQIIHDELVTLLGKEGNALTLKGKPSLIMMIGLQGSGKTTTTAKLANLLQKQNKKVLLVALDIQRPAAIDQLEILAKQIDCDIYTNRAETNIQAIAKDAIQYGQNHDVIILDTAGRLQIDNDLMADLILLSRTYQSSERLIVVDSMTGQEAANVVQTFDQQVGITGAILSKMDSDSRGGAALSIAELTGKPIKYITTGEKITDIDVFEAERIAGRMLGYGDIVSLVKSIEANISQQEMQNLEKKFLSGQFDFALFLQMQRLTSQMGGFGSIFGMMGLGKQLGLDKQSQDKVLTEGMQKMKNYEYIIQSMTTIERQSPEVLQASPSRIRRIAKGSGKRESEVKKMVDEFLKMKKMLGGMAPMLQAMSKGKMPNLMDILNMQKQQAKSQKVEKKQSSGSIFGGGAFMRF